jgi:carbon starvation protein
VIFNDYVDAGLAAMFMLVVVSVLVFGIRTVLKARAAHQPSVKESAYEALPASAVAPQ